MSNIQKLDAKQLEKLYVSGGKLGMQLRLSPEDLKTASRAVYGDVIRKEEK